jgi:membrane fusion protein, multidrug efflux system
MCMDRVCGSGRRGMWSSVCRNLALLLIPMAAFFVYGCSGSGGTATTTGGGGSTGRGGRGGRGGDVPVSVAVAAEKAVPVEIQVIGNVEAYATIGVRAQVSGQLTEVHFKEGDFVKAKDLLLKIDPRPFDAALSQATANNARDQATLGQAQANLARDEANSRYQQAQAKRYAQLLQNGVVSRDQAEQVQASADASTQAVVADRAAIDSAKAAMGASAAAIETAKIQLGYTTIQAPIDGRTGTLNIKQGNVVTANSLDLLSINQVEPIYVTFSVPESQLPAIKQYMADNTLEVRAAPQDSPGGEEVGQLTFVDNSVDMTTGTIKLKGTFKNQNRQLWPGQFVRVTLRLTTRNNAVVVPNEAVQTGQAGAFVYVVKADKTVESRPITANVRVGQDMVIDKGLEAGETVVTEGQLRLVPGSRVAVREGRGAAGATGQGRGEGRGAAANTDSGAGGGQRGGGAGRGAGREGPGSGGDGKGRGGRQGRGGPQGGSGRAGS